MFMPLRAATERGLLRLVPAPIAPLIGVLLGICFAWASANELARCASGAVGTRGLLVAAAFGMGIVAPCVAQFLIIAPGWSWAYLVAPGRLSRALDLGAALAAALSVPAGYLAAARASGSRQLRPVVRLVLVPALASALLLAALTQRWSVYASYAQFHGAFGTRSLAGSWLGYSVLWSLIVLISSALWTLRALARSGDPSRQR